MDRAAGPKFLIFMSFALEDRLVEAVEASSRGQAVAKKDTVPGAHGQGENGKQLKIGGINFRRAQTGRPARLH